MPFMWMRRRSRSATISGAPNFSIASAMQSLTRPWQELKNTSLSSAARCATGTYDLNSVVALMRSLLQAGPGLPPDNDRDPKACRARKTLLQERKCGQLHRTAGSVAKTPHERLAPVRIRNSTCCKQSEAERSGVHTPVLQS